MNEKLRSRAEIESALKAANEAFEGFCHIAAGLADRVDEDPDYFRSIEDRAVGHGAIVHILQWILGQHNDPGIDLVVVTKVQPWLFSVKAFPSCDSLV